MDKERGTGSRAHVDDDPNIGWTIFSLLGHVQDQQPAAAAAAKYYTADQALGGGNDDGDGDDDYYEEKGGQQRQVEVEEVDNISSNSTSSTGSAGGCSRAAAGGSSSTIRIVQIFSPLVVHTDVANFRSLVQRLTGKDSAQFFNQKRSEAAARQKSNIILEYNSTAPAGGPSCTCTTTAASTSSTLPKKKLNSSSNLCKIRQPKLSLQHVPRRHRHRPYPAMTAAAAHASPSRLISKHNAGEPLLPQSPNSRIWDLYNEDNNIPLLPDFMGAALSELFHEPSYPLWPTVGDSYSSFHHYPSHDF